MHQSTRMRGAAVAAAVLSLVATPTAAREGGLGPAPALEFPVQADPSAPRGISLGFMRAAMERAADDQLCLILMMRDGRQGPLDAQGRQTCLPDYAAKVAANEGFIQWAPGARPVSCTDCFGRPFMSQQDHVDRPNLRRVTVFGRLAFRSVTGPNRTITYPFQVHATCAAPNGARQGQLVVDLRFDPPVLGEPGFWENLGSFLTVGELSRQVEQRIGRELRGIPGQQLEQGACQSVGIDLGDRPLTDTIRFDPPTTKPIRPGLLAEQATIRLLSLTRKPLPPMVPAEHARPGSAEGSQFTLFVNGTAGLLPPDGLSLPPEGGTVALNHCKTVSLTGAQQLQILFANGLGGAAWSEFARPDRFGTGAQRVLTTGRTIVVPGLPGPPDPVTGRPAPARPQPVAVREFELRYEIMVAGPPTLSTAGAAAGETRGEPGAPTGVSGGTGSRPPADPGEGPARPPCVAI